MHAGVIAYRKAEAQKRINDHLGNLSKKLDLDVDPASLNQTSNDLEVADMLRTEAVADLLGAIDKKVAKIKPVKPVKSAPEDQAVADLPAEVPAEVPEAK